METGLEFEGNGPSGRGRYRKRSLAEKRAIVEACLKPGASVAGVFLAHGANANLVRKWIAKYRAEEAGVPSVPLLAVSIAEAAVESVEAGNEGVPRGYIEIETKGARLRVHGRVNGEALRMVLSCLVR